MAGGVITFAVKLRLKEGSLLTVKLSGGVTPPPAYVLYACGLLSLSLT